MRAGLAFAWLASATLLQAQLKPVDESAYQKLLASHRGQVVLVDFWATWCAPCVEELPLLAKLEAKYRSQGVRLIAVSCDEPEQEKDAQGFLKKAGVAAPGYLKRVADDEKFITFVDQKWSGALPALFLYDRQGRKVKAFIGEAEMAAVEEALRKALK